VKDYNSESARLSIPVLHDCHQAVQGYIRDKLPDWDASFSIRRKTDKPCVLARLNHDDSQTFDVSKALCCLNEAIPPASQHLQNAPQ